jgi:hypothetical protein
VVVERRKLGVNRSQFGPGAGTFLGRCAGVHRRSRYLTTRGAKRDTHRLERAFWVGVPWSDGAVTAGANRAR